jgi:hypothetical protein
MSLGVPVSQDFAGQRLKHLLENVKPTEYAPFGFLLMLSFENQGLARSSFGLSEQIFFAKVTMTVISVKVKAQTVSRICCGVPSSNPSSLDDMSVHICILVGVILQQEHSARVRQCFHLTNAMVCVVYLFTQKATTTPSSSFMPHTFTSAKSSAETPRRAMPSPVLASSAILTVMTSPSCNPWVAVLRVDGAITRLPLACAS